MFHLYNRHSKATAESTQSSMALTRKYTSLENQDHCENYVRELYAYVNYIGIRW